MTLVRFDDVSLEFGDQPILRHAALAIEPAERVCLIGRNGAGKTTLLKLMAGTIEADHGEIEYRTGLRISQLEQNLPESLDQTVRQTVTAGLSKIRSLIEAYETLSSQTLDKSGLRELESLQQQIESADGWNLEQRVDTILTEMQLPPERKLDELSGGWRRRVSLAKALVSKPDLLLLDEPTNHLDLVSIRWLEDNVYAYPGSVVFVTHDRAFVQRLATRILELDRGRLVSWPCDYREYLIRQQKSLEDEVTHNALFDKKLAEEEAWVRQGIKARRTRNEGRVRALQRMRGERAARLEKPQQARISIEEGERSGRKVIRLRGVNYRYEPDVPLIENLSLTIMRGDRVGLIGNNGVGKSTLLNLLLGNLSAQSGTVKLGTNLDIGYFDQLRRTLDPDKSVAENVGGGRDYIRINGKDRHVIGYLRGFLFSAKRAMTPVRALSGGERNRIILAKLFTRPTNLLVLDEPTNDLDVETLEVLENRLVEYDGTLIVVSHDREFLDNVVTSILVFEADGSIQEYVGGFSDWQRRNRQLAERDDPNRAASASKLAGNLAGGKAQTKLSYMQQRELDDLPAQIDNLENETKVLQERISAADFYTQDHASVQVVLGELEKVNRKLEKGIERWSELEELREALLRAK